jgi:hypothetical protein
MPNGPSRPGGTSLHPRLDRRSWLWASVAIFLTILVSAGGVPASAAHFAPSPKTAHLSAVAPTPSSAPRPSVTFPVFGNLQSWAPPGGAFQYLFGVGVSAVSTPCKGFDNCTAVTSTLSGLPTGSWTLNLPSGTYAIYSNSTTVFGGGEVQVTVGNTPMGPINLTAYPLLTYQNASFVLPGWNNLSKYAENCNLALPCRTGAPSVPYGSQVPITSWTQDGVFYVNITFDLVFYSFANRTVQNISTWLPLYNNLMDYDGIENTEWITADGSVVYEFGCKSSCVGSSFVYFYAVNVTTGRSFQTAFTGVDEGQFAQNGQVDIVGESGNMSVASIIDQSGVDIGYNLWNGTQWNLTKLPFFEANNLYWIPQLESYFDVQAGGSSTDRIVQYRLEGPAPGSSLVQVGAATFAKMYKSNGVNGLVFNATNRTITFTVQNATGTAITLLFSLGANGTLGGLVRTWGNGSSRFGSGPDTSAYPNVESSEHRPTYVSNGPAFAGFWNGWFQNRSWLVDPVTGQWYDTNQTFNHPDPMGYAYRENHLNPSALEGLFLNTSYALIPWSYDCRTVKSSCPILGTASNPTSVGTVWWTWREGLPEFPFPNTSARAQIGPPSDPTGLNLTTYGRTIQVRWTPPSQGIDPLLNYTVYYGTTPGNLSHSVSVAPQAASASIESTAPGTLYHVVVQAWNLHWHSPGANGSITTGLLFGTLNLTVLPGNASATIDGRPAPTGGGLVSIVLEQGNHTVNVTDAGYYPFSTMVEVTWQNFTDLNVQLVGIPPILSGTVNPTWSLVDLGGTAVPVGGNGSFQVVLTPGNYTLTATAPGFVPFGPANVALRFGDTRTLSIDLAHTTGWIDGLVSPSTAEVTLDGAPVDTPNGTFELHLDTGLYWLDAFAPGYHSLTIGPINVTEGQIIPELLGLIPYNGSWNFSVSPSDSNLSVDGQSVGVTAGHAAVILAPGYHTFLVSRPGYDSFGSVSLVAPNSTALFDVVLNRSLGWIVGTIEPFTAALSINGRAVALGDGGSFNLTVLPASYEIVATAPGYTELLRSVNVSAHHSTYLVLKLARITATDSGAALFEEWELALLALLFVAVATGLIYYWKRPPRQKKP